MTYTAQDYKNAAAANLWFAKMERLYDNTKASKAHFDLADLYIKQELKRDQQC